MIPVASFYKYRNQDHRFLYFPFGEVNANPPFAETHPRTPELTPEEEMKKAVPVTAGREKEGSLPGELD
jgi:hypothetical protein